MPGDAIPQTEEFTPATQAELSRFVAENAAGKRQALYPVGGRTALHYGFPPTKPGVMISTTHLKEVVDYPARDMTVTVEAGTRMDELAALLKEEGQQLPVDVPQSHRATLGGVIATNPSGPRRLGYGTLRDYVIGISAVDAQGRLFKAGGRVVKNVAGYDLCKLLIGSLGTLGIVTQVTLKLRPLPESAVMVWATFPGTGEIDAALERLVTSQTRPVVLEVLNPEAARQIANDSRQDLPADQPVLIVGFDGSSRETRWQTETLKAELNEHGPQRFEVVEGESERELRTALTEFPTVSDASLTFQANGLPSKALDFVDRATRMGIAVQSHAGNGIVVGHLPDEAATVEQVAEVITPLRNLARQNRGNLIILNYDAGRVLGQSLRTRSLPIFGDPEASWSLMKHLKDTLDPYHLLNPGRLFGEVR